MHTVAQKNNLFNYIMRANYYLIAINNDDTCFDGSTSATGAAYPTRDT